MFKELTVLALALASGRAMAATGSDAAHQIERLSRARYAALNQGDAHAFDRIYADDYEFVSYWGRRYGVDFLKSWLASGDHFKLTPSHYKVRVSDDGSMGFAVLDLHEEYFGKPNQVSTSDTVFTEIYQKNNGVWKLVQGHNSRKTKAPWEK